MQLRHRHLLTTYTGEHSDIRDFRYKFLDISTENKDFQSF